ncbi:MAG: GEVED domain-containing protein [Flavobacterium sp.]|nr:GEVED domain-containing protein [Flavobacterium sp.]
MVTTLLCKAGVGGFNSYQSVWRALFALCFLYGLSTQAQVATYVYDTAYEMDATGTYIPIVGTALTTASNWDNQPAVTPVVPIFDFVYNGVVYSQVKISYNGFIAFGGTLDVVPGNVTPISTATPTQYVGAISAMGQDLVGAGFGTTPIYSEPTSIRYETQGAVGSRVFIVQWENAARKNTTTSALTGLFNFQIRLYESSNVIEIWHDTTTFLPTVVSGTSIYRAQIGLRGSTDFNNRTNFVSSTVYSIPPTFAGTINTSYFVFHANSYFTQLTRFRWIPPCFPPTAPTVSGIGVGSATVGWTGAASVPGNGYEYEVLVSGTSDVVASGTVAAGPFSIPLTGLPEGINLVFRVRSLCGVGFNSVWVNSSVFQTTCGIRTVPYVQDFEVSVAGGIPGCSSLQTLSGNSWAVSTLTSIGFGPKHLRYTFNTVNAANSWYYTQQVSLTAGTTYRLSYRYGATNPALNERLRSGFGLVNAAGSMVTLDTHPSVKTSPLTNVVHFTPTTSGNYYFGFNCYSDASQENLLLDDIQVDFSSCLRPTGLTAANISFSSAIVYWTPPTPVPSNGYAYYLSTSSTAPVNGTLPTGFVSAGGSVLNLSGLTQGTNYYIWVRSSCGANELGEWSAVLPFTTLTPAVATYCVPAPISVDGQGITRVQLGTIDNITGAEAGNYGNYSALSTNASPGEVVPLTVTFSTAGYSYNARVWVDWNNNNVFEDPGELVASGVSPLPTPGVLSLNFTVPALQALGSYRVRIGGRDTGYGIPTPCSTASWSSFEDYTLQVIQPAPALALTSYNEGVCAGESSNIVHITPATLGNFDSYTWTPALGVSGNPTTGYVFSPTITTTYVLTGNVLSPPFSTRSVSLTVQVNPIPSPVVITASDTSVCLNGSPVTLTKTGGTFGGNVVMSYDFNDATLTNGWTKINTSSGGSTAAPDWTLRNSPYTTPYGIMANTDGSQFIVSNSDSQGSGTNTLTYLRSPVFSLVGYTNAVLSFYHFYRGWNNGAVRVQISTNGAAGPFTDLVSYGPNNTQGSYNNFKNEVINFTAAHLGQGNLMLQFSYEVSWGYYWAIDNVLITGNAPITSVWSPQEGLFLNEAMTLPYVGGPEAVVYALPTTTTTYTATSTTLALCDSSASVEITVDDFVAGTLSGDQTTCSGALNDIVLTGATNPVIRWESASNAAFTNDLQVISNTTTTLTVAEIGVLTDDTYFRAVLSNGFCEKASDPILVSFPKTTNNGLGWDNFEPDSGTKAVFTGNTTVSSSLEACSLEVVSGVVTVQSGVTFWVANTVVVQPGASLIFENNASLVQDSSAENTGAIVYRRDAQPMYKNDYTYWSSPVASQEIRAFSPLTKLDRYFRYNNVTDNWSSVFSFPDVGQTHTMIAGEGYIIRAPENYFPFPTATIFNGEFTGVPNNGPYSVSINSVGTSNWNLIGNPYPSAIDIHAFWEDAANELVVDATIYLWTHNSVYAGGQYNPNDYAVYNYTGTAATAPGLNMTTPSRYIAAGQSFFIEGATNGIATFRNSMRVSGFNTQFFRTMGVPVVEDASSTWERNRIWLGISNPAGAYKQALVGYIQNATNGIDRGFDGKSVEAGNSLNLYTIAVNQNLTIQGKALPFVETDLIPVGYRAATAGSYTISLENFDGLFETQNIYLEDLLLQTVHDLKQSAYTFTTANGTHNQRFQLRFTNETLGVDTVSFGSNKLFAYKSGEGLVVKSSESLLASVAVYDLRGRLLVVKTAVNALEISWNSLPFAEQVLLVKMTSIDGQEVTQKVVF